MDAAPAQRRGKRRRIAPRLWRRRGHAMDFHRHRHRRVIAEERRSTPPVRRAPESPHRVIEDRPRLGASVPPPARPNDVPIHRIRPPVRAPARRAVPRPARALAGRQAGRRRVQAAAPAERLVRAALCADAARGRALRRAVQPRSCACWRRSPANTTQPEAEVCRNAQETQGKLGHAARLPHALRPLHHAHRTCSSTGSRWPRAPT